MMNFWCDSDDDTDQPDYVARGRKFGHPLGAGAPHIPNKQEAKELRRLMQKSGESEEQVRSNLANRRKLAKAAKSSQASGNRHRIVVMRLRRRIAASMGLPAYAPQVQDAALAQLKRQASRRFY